MKYPKMLMLFGFILSVNTASEFCCPNNKPFINNKCNNDTTSVSWPKYHCLDGAYFLYPNTYKVTDDGYLQFGKRNIAPKKYCLGSIDDKNIAVVCFQNEDNDTAISTFISFICIIISIICLAFTLAIYLYLPKLRDLQGKCTMCTITSFLVAFSLLAFIRREKTNFSYNVCLTIAMLMYFWFLSTFFWLNIITFNIWRIITRPKWLTKTKYLFHWYIIYGWGCPFMLLLILLVTHSVPGNHIKPGFATKSCWFPDFQSRWSYFNGIIFVLILMNIALFASTIWNLWKQEKNTDQIQNKRKYYSRKFKCFLYLKVFLITGLCWIFEPVSDLFNYLTITSQSYIWIVTDYINALQGLLIFLFLIVFRKRVRHALATKIACCKQFVKEDDECKELEEDVDEIETDNEDNNEVRLNDILN